MSVHIQPTFKIPESIPQDLLLIQNIIGDISQASQSSSVTKQVEDDISSSASEDDSDVELDEVEAHLAVTAEENCGAHSPGQA
jgi:H/ACA ribonucleoprotein complex non-core subunit NAF1